MPVSTADGSYTVPQAGTLQLTGKDMKVIVAGYPLDSAHLVYSTSHLMTHAPVGGQDVAVLASRPGDDGETVLRYPAAASGPAVRVLGGFRLDVPPGVDASLGLTITDTPSKSYRAQIFLNGWNVGQYINNVGPQTTFVLPNGLLRTDGENTLAIAVLADGSTDGGLGSVTLANLGTVAGGVPVHPVLAPDR